MTTREQAMNWWNGLFEYTNPSGINKSALTEKYFGKDRRYQSLSGREIESIWKKEIGLNRKRIKEILDYNEHLKMNDGESIKETHNKLRNILIDYGSEEWGDCIIDEICELFNFPTTHEE